MKMRRVASRIALALVAACSSSDDSTSEGRIPAVCTDCTPLGAHTYRLATSDKGILWTATTMDKIVREATPPDATGDALTLSAARNEFEPIQVVVRASAAAQVTFALKPFPFGRAEIHRVGYVNVPSPTDASSIPSSAIPDPLEPTSFGNAEAVPAQQNQPFWITFFVPKDAPAGDYETTLTVTLDGVAQDIPVRLHVFDFTLPDKIGFDGGWNSSFEALGGSQSLDAVQALKTWFFEHRLVPTSVAWPAGLNYNGGIDYDCASGAFTEQANDYDFSRLGPKYIDGAGWNGVGFPSFQAMGFVDNSTPRPDSFCNVPRGDVYGTAAYNAAWSKLLSAVDAYEVAHHWENKGYYYVQNEPQNQADYDIAATLASISKTAAPHLRIAISEEPKPEIAENPKANGKSYDLWMANLSAYDPVYAKKRQALGEQVWWYFLYGDRPPHFNPTTIDHQGIEGRIGHWAAWVQRIRGFYYYSVTGWGQDPYTNPRPEGTDQNGDGFLLYPPKDGKLVTSIRWELLREGAEDFEYLLLAAGGTMPKTTDEVAGCDVSAKSAAPSPTSFTHDASALMDLRQQLGSFLEKKVNGCPLLVSSSPGVHKKGVYYINFQDPAGQPTASPLTVNGHDWVKIGWDPYDPKKGYGWAGPNIGHSDIMLYSYLADAPVSELERSIIYDDYGRVDTFNWDIEPGRYRVTVSIGWSGRTYDKQRVVVEGTVLYDNAATTPTAPYLKQSVDVDVTDGNVSLEVGQTNEYTMLNWMSIEAL
jgi:hypothetical protein